ncbi:hypothetical protein H5410_050664 [Solanum commersonii]|uniref:Uncharacterized protein n=1 Tax=Solanum commersonii TaxID=4109 RepID=A0A9J5WXP4_SOLCO|nr:hypothetical protein H5410_050664 [Solanum commersonii]
MDERGFFGCDRNIYWYKSLVPSRATYPVSNEFLSDTHLPHEGKPTPYPTHSLELSVRIWD